MEVLKDVKGKSGTFRYSQKETKACACGNLDLKLVETEKPMMRDGKQIYPARTKIHCPKCKTSGVDTCHGEQAAIGRWNTWAD